MPSFSIMSDEAKDLDLPPSFLIVHADKDIISIPAKVADKVPKFRKHILEKGYQCPISVEMNAVGLYQTLESDFDTLPPLKKAKHKQQLEFPPSLVGKWVDARDVQGRWYHAQIIDESPAKVKVAFAGWSSKCDEWLFKTSDCLRVFGEQGKLLSKGIFFAPDLGDDVGRGRVWTESFEFTVQPTGWM